MEDVIFWDTEFSTLDPYEGEIISLGMVKASGAELYLELDSTAQVHPWVEEHILPTLTQPKVSRGEATTIITEFLGNNTPRLISYVTHLDSVYLLKLFIHQFDITGTTKSLPFHWIPLDFATILYTKGIDPEALSSKYRNEFCKGLNIDATSYQPHHALDDARLLKEVYTKVMGE